MKYKWISGIMLAIAFFMSGASFASPFSGNEVYSEPIYDTVAFTTDTADPLDTAVKPDNSGIVNWRYGVFAVYTYLDTVPVYSETVLACGYSFEPVKNQSKIPIAV